MAAMLQTSEHFDCLWNQIRILKVQYISFIPKIIFWLYAATLKQSVVVQYSPWRPSWKMAAILKTTKQYLFVSITLKIHSMFTYQLYQIIVFDCLLLFSKYMIIFQGSPWRPSWKSVAILNWSHYEYSICIVNWTVYMLKYSAYSSNHLFDAANLFLKSSFWCCQLRQN